MSTDLGLAYGEEQISSERANAKSIFVGTGSDIANISVASPIPAAYCTEDGAGFTLNHFYLRHYDPEIEAWTGWDDAFRKHTHSDDTETEGGDFYDIEVANAEQRYSVFRPSMSEEYFIFTDSGDSGAEVVMFHDQATDTQYMELRTGNVTDAWAQVQDGGINLSLNSPSEWHVKVQIDTQTTETEILWRMGVGMELADETSDDTLQKYGIEGCTGDGANIQLVSCDGDTRNKTSTGIAMEQAASIGVKVAYVPSTSVIYEDTIGTLQASSGNFPSSGNIESDKTIRYGIKSTNTTGKEMRIWADALYGKILDPSWI